MAADQIRRYLAEIERDFQVLMAAKNPAPGSATAIAQDLLSGKDVIVHTTAEGRPLTLRGMTPQRLLGKLADPKRLDLDDEALVALAQDNIAAAIRNVQDFHEKLLAYGGLLEAAEGVVQSRRARRGRR